MEQQKQESMSNRFFKTLLMAIEANLGPVLDDLDATKVSYDAEHKVFLLPIEDKAYADDKAWTQAVLEAVSQSVGNAKVNNIKISKAAELQLNRIVADEQMPKFGFEKEHHDIVLQKTKPELVEKIEHPMTIDGQCKFMQDFMKLIKSVDKATGFFYWEPAMIPVPGCGWASYEALNYTGEKGPLGNEWANQALFDYDGNALPALDVIKNF